MAAAELERGTALRVFVVLAFLVALLSAFGRHYAEAFLPLYRSMLSVVRPDYRVRSLAIEVRNGSLIRAEMERRTLVRDASGRLRPAMVVARASTQMGYVLAHPLILFGVALAWPGLSLRRRFERLLVSLPLLLLVEALDIPLTLAGGFENAPGGTAQAGAEIDWARIMDGGGRYALCIAAAGMAAAMHASWANSRNPPAVVAAP